MNENKHNLRFIIDIQIALDHLEPKLPDKTTMKKWLHQVLAKFKEAAELSVRIVENDEITALNHRYRHKNAATNVLAFPADLPAGIALEHELLGDIVIASEVVKQEAEQQNKSYQAHFAHMLIHGTLHLLGFDHKNQTEAEVMEQHEIDILRELNFDNPYQYN